MITNGKRRSDYARSFRLSANHMYKEQLPPSVACEEVGIMLEQYYDAMGDIPDALTLEKLADAILAEDLADSRAFKSRREEYPVLSVSQLESRTDHEVPLSVPLLDELQSGVIKDTEYINTVKPSRKKVFERKERKTYSFRRNDDARTKWAREVKDRDHYSCQNPKCKSRSGIMHAHHVLNYADYPESRYEVTNGITLCEACHTEFHSLYGKERNNREQINEFFGVGTYKNAEMSVL